MTTDQATMRALGLTERPAAGAAATALRWVEVPTPSAERGQVRVRVVMASLHRDDVHSAEGTVFGGVPTAPKPSPERPRVPGLAFAGVIDAVGAGVDDWQVGDRVVGVVYGTSPIGGLAPLCCTKASRVHRLPDDWSFEQGAAVAFSGTVAALALRTAGDLAAGRCLVVGASGNIGALITAALVEAGASRVVGVCSGANVDAVTSLGAHRVVDYTAGPWGEQLNADGERFDAVFDCVGGRDTEASAVRVLGADGHLVTLCGPMRFLGGRRHSPRQIATTLGHIGWRMATSRARGPRYTIRRRPQAWSRA